MAEFLFPVPAAVLRRFLEHERDIDGPFSEEAATVSVLLDMDRGQVRSERTYAQIWGWGRKRVHKNLDRLIETAQMWRTFFKAGPVRDQSGTNAGPVRDQSGTKPGPKTAPKFNKTDLNGTNQGPSPDHDGTSEEPLRDHEGAISLWSPDTDTDTDTDEEGSPLPSFETRLDFSKVMDDWNRLAEDCGLPKIRAMTPDRKAWVRQKASDIFPVQNELFEEIRSSSFLRGSNDRGWRLTFNALWEERSMWAKILEGSYDDTSQTKGGRPKPRIVIGGPDV